MTWKCAAIDHGLTIFPFGKIGPCCQIASAALRPVSDITVPHRFQDLKTEDPPAACVYCVNQEKSGQKSYRQMFNEQATDDPGIQFLDLRNTNLCNFKCRYCGPHFSNQWAEELGIVPSLKSTDASAYYQTVITPSLKWLYSTGGEPLLNIEHWELLENLIEKNLAPNIELLYNTNLSTVRYKDKDIYNIWKKFKRVNVNVSIDAIGPPLEMIRHGANWKKILTNLETLLLLDVAVVRLVPVMSILNIWFAPELWRFAKEKNISISPSILYGPDYLSLDCLPDALQPLALKCLDEIDSLSMIPPAMIESVRLQIMENKNKDLFKHTLNHVMLLDHSRKENLFDILPFKEIAKNIILNNNEYQ